MSECPPNSIKNVSIKDFIAELKRRISEYGDFRRQVLEALAEKVRPDLKRTITSDSKDAQKRELSPEQTDVLLGILKLRFDKASKKLRKIIDFADVEKALRANPEKLYALQKLEETGGEPQLVGIEKDEFIFEDRSLESPSGRRDQTYSLAVAWARDFKVEMQSPDAYKEMQKTGQFDLKSWSWLQTDNVTRDTGRAFIGARRYFGVRIIEHEAGEHSRYGGWRGVLRVQKV